MLEDMVVRRVIKRVTSLCCNVPKGKMWTGAVYGSKTNIYRPATISDLELDTPQSLLLGLLQSLVVGDVMHCAVLAGVCSQIEKLHSRHYKVWLLEDFVFPRSDIHKAIVLLHKLISEGILKLPPHVMVMMTSLGDKYGIDTVQLRNLSEEWCINLANQLEKAVADNNPGEIIGIANMGGDINGSTQSGDPLIHLAARAGNCASIAALNFLKADLEVENSCYATPMYEAIRYNHREAVGALLKAGAKSGKRLLRGDTYLHFAAAGGYNGALDVLLETGMGVNEKNYLGETPLIRAVKAGNARGVEMLLENGADCSILPKGSKGIIEMVLDTQNPDTLRGFIKNGVDLMSKDGDTLLHLFAQLGNTEMLKLIKNMNLPVNIKNKNGMTPLHLASDPSVVKMLISMGIDLNIKNDKGETALHLASANGSIDLVKTLVQNGADVDLQDGGGITPLMIALEKSKPDIVIFLLHQGANHTIKYKKGRTPLHYAAKGRSVELVTLLLNGGSEVDVQDNEGYTALHLAAENGHTAMVTALVDAGATVDIQQNDNCTALHLAALNGHTAVVTALLDAGATVDIQQNDNCTALHFAARFGHTAVVTALLDAGAEVNKQAISEATALHLAACLDHNVIVTVLLDRGADLAARAENGLTPLMVAAEAGHLALVQLLLDRGAAIIDKDNEGATAYNLAVNMKKTVVADYLRSKGGH